MTASLDVALVALGPYLPALAYLGCVWLLLFGFRRVPSWVHLFALSSGLLCRWFLTGASLGELMLPVVVACGVFFVLVALAARTVSGVSLFSITAGLALTPFNGWPGLVLGVGFAAVVAAVRIWRAMGKERVWFLTTDTLSGLGISTAGGFKPPQPEHIPTREMLMSEEGADGEDTARMYLPPYLFAGVAVAGVTAVCQALS